MKKLLSLALACLLLFSLSACGREPKEEVSDEKPVIYLYPEQETDVRVTLDLAGELTCAYPTYGDGWSVRAAPDGTLTDESGQTYRYLYWEGIDLSIVLICSSITTDGFTKPHLSFKVALANIFFFCCQRNTQIIIVCLQQIPALFWSARGRESHFVGADTRT